MLVRLAPALVSCVLSAAGAPLAQAIVKTGPCPAFTRSPEKMPFGYHGNTKQDPLTPARSINCVETPPGFQASIWASEEDAGNITAVVAFTFDERGRMWALETKDYPSVLTEPFAGHDRILILEDSDNDGSVDKSTVFAEGFNIAQGIEWTPAGLFIAMPPYLLMLEDKNGDDKADDPKGRILYSGLKRTDTHMTISNLHLGLDNWMYGASGSIPSTANGVSFNAGFWRARLDGTKFEYLSRTTNNTWGLGVMEDGQIFGSTANGNESAHFVLKGKEAQQLLANGRIHPVTDDIMQHSYVGKFSAAAGHDLYTARLFPREYWNRAAFVCEPSAHLVAQFFLSPKGSTWSAQADTNRYNIFASKDAWSAPIMAKVGPDGALWIVDWYTYITQHNGDPAGPGAAFITPLRDKKYCRIYRILPAGKAPEARLDLRTAAMAQLAQTLSHANMLWRMQAQRLLLAKASTDAAAAKEAVAALKPLLDGRRKDDADNDPALVHALWILSALGEFTARPAEWNPVLSRLLLHPAAGARRNVLMAMPRTAESSQAIKDQGRVNDPDPQVRLQALLALAEIPGKAGGIAMFADYRHGDKANVNLFRDNAGGLPASWSDTAFTWAGIAESATLPSIPALDPPVALDRGSASPQALAALRAGLRFLSRPDGTLEIAPDASLPPGRLHLYGPLGDSYGSAEYDGRSWAPASLPAGPGLRLYEFRSIAGTQALALRGKLALRGEAP